MMFGSRGYDAVTISDLARQAGVSCSVIKRYFRSKEGLYIVVLHSVVGASLSDLGRFALGLCTQDTEMTGSVETRIRSAIHHWYVSFSRAEARLLQQALMDSKRKAIAYSPLEKIISLIATTMRSRLNPKPDDCATSAKSLIWTLFQLKVAHSASDAEELQQIEVFLKDWFRRFDCQLE
jgi:AcrR family transcriptional regulator